MLAEAAEDAERGRERGKEPEPRRAKAKEPPVPSAPPPRARHERGHHAQSEHAVNGPAARHGAVVKVNPHRNDHLENIQPHGDSGVEEAPWKRRAEQRTHGVAFGMGLRIDRERAGGGGEEKEECKV